MRVNAHTHLELSTLGHLLPDGSAKFSEWLNHVGRSVQGRDVTWFRRACEVGIRQLLDSGTTHVGDISWSGASVEPLSRSGMRGIVWLEMRGVSRPDCVRRFEWLRKAVDRSREIAANSTIEIGIEMHSPYSVHSQLWEPVLRWVELQRLPLCIHTAESPSEWDLYYHGRGDLVHFETIMKLPHLPRWLRNSVAGLTSKLPNWNRFATRLMPRPRGSTPVLYLKEMGALEFQPLLVHMVHVSDEDIELVRQSGSTVVHCPRSNQLLACGRMALEKFLAAQVPVLLGTDSLASSPTLNVDDEVAAAIELHAGVVERGCVERLAVDAAAFEALTSKRIDSRNRSGIGSPLCE